MNVRVVNIPVRVRPEPGVAVDWLSIRRTCIIAAAQGAAIAATLYALLGAWHRDVHVPLTFSSDSLWFLMQSKSTVDGSWWWWNSHIGAPFVYDALAYPSNSNVDQAVVWLVSRFTPDTMAAVNITWALLVAASGVAATWCMRTLGVSTISALVGGTLFALSPYALYRNIDHFSLMVYLVPFPSTIALWLACGRSRSTWPRRTGLVLLAGCVLLSLNYVYYAFFACFCIAAGGIAGYLIGRDRRVLVSTALCLAVIAATTFVNLVPSFESWRRSGRPAILQDKTPAEAEMFGLKIRQLVSPVFPNHFTPFQHWVEREAVARFPNENENWTARLGVVGTMGFLVLVAMWFVPDRTRKERTLLRSASLLTLAAVLLATVGGFGTLFSLFVSSDIRGYNRIYPFIDFFSLAAIAIGIDAWLKTQRSRTIASVVILALGVADQGQAVTRFNERYDATAREVANLRGIVDRLERTLPGGAMVLQLPFRPYMNESDFGRMKQYDHFKPYLVSHSLRFSYPAFSNAQVRWQEEASRMDLQSLVTYLGDQHFSAVLVDRYGYEDGGSAVTKALTRIVGGEHVIAQTDRYVALNITSARDRTRTRDASAFERIPSTLSVQPCDRQTLFTIDQIGATHAPFAAQGVQVERSTEFKIWGWAVDQPNRTAAGGLDVVIDQMVLPSTYGMNRNDVAEYFKRGSYRESGFVASVPAQALAAGKHWVGLRVMSADGICYYQTAGVFVTVN